MGVLTDLLAKSKDEIKKPDVLPEGHYVFQIARPHTEGGNDLWEWIDFLCFAQSPQDDVDISHIERPIDKIPVYLRFIFPAEGNTTGDPQVSEWRLSKFLTDCGAEGETISEIMANAVGCTFIGSLELSPRKDNPEEVQMNIRKTFPHT